MQATEEQVAVIGGGPAGATAATLIAQAGHQVHLFERESFPRFHIGESLMPETYWTFRRLGILDKMKQSGFQRKFSVQFVTESGKESAPFFFRDSRDHECSQTWQVTRSEFDAMLLENAREHGVKTSIGSRVLDVLFEGDQAVGLKVQHPDGSKQEIRTKVIVDASGQSSLISNRLKLREPDPNLRKASIWTYFKGGQRDEGLNEGATIVLHTEGKAGWFWYIPLAHDIVSVGVVSDLETLFGGELKDHEAIFYDQLEKCPGVKPRLENAQRCEGFRSTKDFSYHSKQVAGNGWVLVGDAFGFLDPIYSSGVFLALKSGEMAADAINEGFAKQDLSATQLSKWGPEFLQGMNRMKHLVYAFYEGFNFGRFIRRYPECRKHITDLLIGDVFKDEVDEVLGPMEEVRKEMAAEAVAS